MCCFSRPVTSVAATRIFARFTGPAEQALVYQMHLEAPEDLAMILPIPVPQPAGDRAVTFVNLEKYKAIFKDLERGFPEPETYGLPKPSRGAPVPRSQPLEVHSVGAFDASFVPNPASFTRLDERFRLPGGVWESLPQYANYGFAVFMLKKGRADVHPMAFRFPTALHGQLFFPTVHIHDGKVHAKEEFDHVLYAQAGPNALIPRWRESEQAASAFAKVAPSADLLLGDAHVYRLAVHGLRKNEDLLVMPKRFAD